MTSPSALRLQDCPTWRYLWQEFDANYHSGSSDSSAIIRSHRKRVRDRLSIEVKFNPELLEKLANCLPVEAGSDKS